MNANDARRMVNDYRRSHEEEMQSRAAKLRKEVDKSIQSQASVGGIATFIPRPARLVERYLVQMLTDDGFTVETTNDNNLRIAW